MAGTNYFRRISIRLALLWLIVCTVVVNGVKDVYSNSFISPNSANEKIADSPETGYRTSGPSEIDAIPSKKSLSPVESEISSSKVTHIHRRVERSADPILSRTSGHEGLANYKNIEESLESNDVELSGRIGDFIQPSKTDKHAPSEGVEQTVASSSGEVQGAPQARSLPLQEPQKIMPTATIPGLAIATLSPQQARAHPSHDIQDIITGIVKLLNGNVNVQANTAPVMGRPLRPLTTRINNRGPPRITDVPALPPDFDLPAPPLPPPPLGQMPPPVSSTRLPTPYPFDLPPQNTSPKRPYIPLPDQGVPGSRPGIYRPVTIPPWHRQPPRRPPNRRPKPPYKPTLSTEDVSLTSERPIEDILTLDLGSQLEPSSEEVQSNETFGDPVKEEPISENNTNNIALEMSEPVDKETLEFEKKKEKSSSKMEKRTKTSSPQINSSHTIQENSSIAETTEILTSSVTEISMNSSTTSISSETAHSIEPSSVLPTLTSTEMSSSTLYKNELSNATSTDIVGEATPVLESSIHDVLQTLKEDLLGSTSITSTPTESLPVQSSTVKDSIGSASSTISKKSTTAATIANQTSSSQHPGFPYYPYKPRPGIVLDDTEYKPGGLKRQPIITRPPLGQLGDIFDITVSAIQGPGGTPSGQGKPFVIPVEIDDVHATQSGDVITSPVGSEGFVSIDGKRTYLNLFGESTSTTATSMPNIKSTASLVNHITGTGYAVVETEKPKPIGSVKPTQRRPLFGRPKPSQPPVRIDTCIVGDDSTCDVSQHEICRTEAGVSACHCRPGHARRKHRDPCRKIVSVLISLRVDRIYDRRVVWASELLDKSSDSYQQLSYEAERALESAMSMTPFSDEFLSAKVNSVYRGERAAGQGGVFVNLTLQLDENLETLRPSIRGDIQKHLLGVIQRRSNNVGNSALWVDSPPGSVSNIQDLDECSSPQLHDCHVLATCINVFGGFRCECEDGYRDIWADNKHRAGRYCEQCSPQHCNNRGECKYQHGQEVCICSGNYYGNQCELDGEVLGVAIGASVAAVIIIGLTLVCLVMWSRRWSREQKAGVGSPVFGYMATASNTVKAPVMGAPPYQMTIEDRMRWAQIADVMAQTNHYAPEPVTGPTRPSSALFGYPNMSRSGTLQHGSMHGTLPPVPLPRLNLQAQMASRAASLHGMRPLDNSSSSEEEDKVDLLGRSFHVPRPKSRSNASIANQSGIYYDVDYDQNEIYKQVGGIPMSTYSIGRPTYYRN